MMRPNFDEVVVKLSSALYCDSREAMANLCQDSDNILREVVNMGLIGMDVRLTISTGAVM